MMDSSVPPHVNTFWPDRRRADEPRRARLRPALAPAQGAHHLRDRPGRGPHGGLDLHAAAVLEAENPKKEICHVHQLARRRRHRGHGDLRHHAVHPPADLPRCASARPRPWARCCCARARRACAMRCPTRASWCTSPRVGSPGQASDIERHAEDIIKMKRRLNEVYVKHTKKNYETIEKTLDRDYFMTAEQARSSA